MYDYTLRHLFTYQRLKLGLGVTMFGIIVSLAIFVYILRHLCTYQRLKLG